MEVTKSSEAIFEKLTIGDRVRWLMEKRGVKQVELAAKIGITQAGVSNIVTSAARKPSAPTLMRLAEELGCNPNWILTGKGDPFGWAPVTSEKKVRLLNLFDAMTDESRNALLAVAESMRSK